MGCGGSGVLSSNAAATSDTVSTFWWHPRETQSWLAISTGGPVSPMAQRVAQLHLCPADGARHRRTGELCRHPSQRDCRENHPRPLEQVLSVNLNSVFLGARHVVSLMHARGDGAIVNISSLNGIRGTPGALAYAASKGSVVAVTMSMVLDYASENIPVNCICPGSVHTPMVQAVYAETPDPEAARQARVSMHPLGRDGDPEDIAAAIAFLASDDASFMTGQAIAVDGGRSAVG